MGRAANHGDASVNLLEAARREWGVAPIAEGCSVAFSRPSNAVLRCPLAGGRTAQASQPQEKSSAINRLGFDIERWESLVDGWFVWYVKRFGGAEAARIDQSVGEKD